MLCDMVLEWPSELPNEVFLEAIKDLVKSASIPFVGDMVEGFGGHYSVVECFFRENLHTLITKASEPS